MPRTVPILPALLLAACTATGGSGAGYQFTITPVVPRNQDTLLSSLDRMDLVVDDGTKDPATYELTGLGTGDVSTFDQIPVLDGAVLELRGYIGNNLAAYGRTEAQTVDSGTLNVRVLLTAVDEFAELSPLPESLAFAAMAPGGDGRFLFFGGNGDGVYSSTAASATIYALDLAPADTDLLFSALDVAMPPRDDGGLGRICHSATAMTRGGHDQVGQILVAGGAGALMSEQDGTYSPDMSTITWSAFLFDPATDTVNPLSEAQALVQPRCGHTATELPNGDIVLVGGLGAGGPNYINVQDSVEIYDPVKGGFDYYTGDHTGPFLFHAAAALGDSGVLVCGGMKSGSTFSASGACDLVSASGTISAATALPDDVAVIHPAMAPLPDGRVLLAGGATPSGTSDLWGFPADVTNRAWIYDNGTWTETDSMSIPRAMHKMVALPDGDVLVVGGVDEISGFWNMDYGSAAAVPCAELFDAATERFAKIGDCDTKAGIGALPLPTALPAVALDPDFGVLVAGGLSPDERATNGVSLYVPTP
ncbi:MAG: hypothetical protein GXP62_13265 [Oligoflexia bacterium]|nr:hypothetical protein [Oligoflexia bacterium]